MFVRLGKIFLILALVSSIGAHWALMQAVAWTAMLADNLQKQSVHEAVMMTFDGQHPCPICKAIAAEKKSETKNESSPLKQKLEFSLEQSAFVLLAPSRLENFPAPDSSLKPVFQKPPVPPPRGLFV